LATRNRMARAGSCLEARARIELAIELLQSSALPLGYRAFQTESRTLHEKKRCRKT
jgi:predicted HTH domain antitoxin